MIVPAPGAAPDGAATLATFKELEGKFNYDPLITKYLVETLKLATLEDFMYLVTTESELPAAVTGNIGGLPTKPLQVSRLRQAWLGVKQASQAAESL